MTTASSWHYNKRRLAEALARWAASGPDASMRAAVNDALMDLIGEPPSWGIEDPEHPGLYHRQIRAGRGVRISFLYAIPDPTTREVAIADIRTDEGELEAAGPDT